MSNWPGLALATTRPGHLRVSIGKTVVRSARFPDVSVSSSRQAHLACHNPDNDLVQIVLGRLDIGGAGRPAATAPLVAAARDEDVLAECLLGELAEDVLARRVQAAGADGVELDALLHRQ